MKTYDNEGSRNNVSCKTMLEFPVSRGNTKKDEWLWSSMVCRAVTGSAVITYKEMPEQMPIKYNKADTGSIVRKGTYIN